MDNSPGEQTIQWGSKIARLQSGDFARAICFRGGTGIYLEAAGRKRPANGRNGLGSWDMGLGRTARPRAVCGRLTGHRTAFESFGQQTGQQPYNASRNAKRAGSWAGFNYGETVTIVAIFIRDAMHPSLFRQFYTVAHDRTSLLAPDRPRKRLVRLCRETRTQLDM